MTVQNVKQSYNQKILDRINKGWDYIFTEKHVPIYFGLF